MSFFYYLKHPSHWNSKNTTIIPYVRLPLSGLFFLDMDSDFHFIDRTKEWPLYQRILRWLERKTYRFRVFLNHSYHIFRWKLWKWSHK
jgi:hypothetical protein